MVAVADGADTGLADVLGRPEVGLARAETDDVHALGLEGLGLGADGQGHGWENALDSPTDLHGHGLHGFAGTGEHGNGARA